MAREAITRVLVIEDERGLAAALAHGLAEEGFATDVAYDGVDGLWRVVNEPYDVIVLDIMLPGLSGYEILKRLRAASVWTPVLMLTAMDGEYDEADALDIGADDYLSKPFSYVVLVAHLRALLRRGAPARPAVLAADDLTLDPASRRCRRAGRELALTAREFTLLEFLIRHRDEVVSKTAPHRRANYTAHGPGEALSLTLDRGSASGPGVAALSQALDWGLGLRSRTGGLASGPGPRLCPSPRTRGSAPAPGLGAPPQPPDSGLRPSPRTRGSAPAPGLGAPPLPAASVCGSAAWWGFAP
ncbi:response regulator [Streptomyces asiaticus]|uniref:response regulator transcription factor n=1 Tax=Streptomyces asiaticus TaxID=114695 RepID=UPI003F6677C5